MSESKLSSQEKTNYIHSDTAWADSVDSLYQKLTQQVKSFSERLNDSLPKPQKVAEAVYQADNNQSGELRYSPHRQAFLLLHALLPDRLWQSLVGQMVLRKKLWV